VSAPLVSIVIPTRNGAATLPALLSALQQQTSPAFETVIVDSSSTDGTPDIARRHGARVTSITTEQFNHGATRNVGIQQAKGDLIILMVQDAVPADGRWLQALTAPLSSDPGLAGTFARQIPRADARPLTRLYHQRWIGSSTEPRTVALTAAEYQRLGAAARLDRCTFDNVCSCIRRSVWVQHPFRPTTIAEDVEWAREVLLAGYRLAFVPDAVVVHSHERPVAYEFERTYVLHRRLYELVGLQTIPSVPMLGRAVAATALDHLRHERSVRSLALACAWPLGQYMGARAAARGGSARPVEGI
jgi:rhamnosyltransferase